MKRRKLSNSNYRRLSMFATEVLETRIVLDADVTLSVFVDSDQVDIPVDIGVDSGGQAISQVTSQDANGSLRVEALNGESVDDVTLGDFFETWRTNAGVAGNNASATLSSSDLLGNVPNTTSTLQMFVNGNLSQDFENYVLQDQDRIVLVYSDNPVVSLNTTFGPLVFELFEDEAPGTVDNFLNYFNDGDFVDSFFHRSVDNFVIQGGGFSTTSTTFTSATQFDRIDPDPAIANEPGMANLRGTVAMAKTSDPDSATNQFFVNISDNTSLDSPTNSGGFTVFAQILDIGVADEINALPIRNVNINSTDPYGEVPIADDDTLVVVESLVGSGEISGTHFADDDANGLLDSSESPIENATVFLDANANGTFDSGEVSTTTDANGRYLFQVDPGTYTVVLEPDAGSFLTVPDGADSYTVTVESGRESGENDFGVAAIPEDLIAEDDTFEILDDAGQTTFDVLQNDSVPTDASLSTVTQGSFGGNVVINGDQIDYTAPVGFIGTETFTYTLAETGGGTETATVSVTVTNSDVGSVSGIVYLDRNQNGTQDTDNNEVGVPGSQITLSGTTTESSEQITLTQITDINGAYSFEDVPAGTYTLTQQQPEAIVNGEVSDDDGNMSPAENEIASIEVTGGANLDGNDFVEGSLDVDYASIVWFFASSGSPEAAFREAIAVGEETAGNMELAAMIREIDDPMDDPTDGGSVDPDDPDTPDDGGSGDGLTVVVEAYNLMEETTFTADTASGVLANDSGAGELSAILETPPQNGTLTLDPDGSFEYVPDANFFGTDSFVYRVTDGTSEATSTATLFVSGVNDVPLVANDSFDMNEDQILQVAADSGVLANDSDPEGTTLTAEVLTDPSEGTLSLQANGSLSYAPNSNFAGTDSFTYRVTDEDGGESTATATINVRPINDQPVANDDSYIALEDTEFEVMIENGVLNNDTDIEDNPLTAVISQNPTNGSVTLNSDGSFVYTPTGGFSGEDSFEYVANDGSDDSDAAVVTITVDSSLSDFSEDYNVDEDTILAVGDAQGVLANDPEGVASLTAELAQGPSSGNLTLNDDGSFTYDPEDDFSGVVNFIYDVTDDQAAAVRTSAATITIAAVNDAPDAVPETYEANEDELLEINVANGVLANDSDAEGGALTAVVGDLPTNGTLTLNADGSFDYLPDANFGGTDTFTYGANDGSVSTLATVTINVQALNDRPTTADDSYNVNPGISLTVSEADGVLANDFDVEGDSMTAAVSTAPTSGSVQLQTDGSFVYTPNDGFTGTDTFQYEAFDGLDFSESTVTIEVNPVTSLRIASDVQNGDVIGRVIPTTQFSDPVIYQEANPTLDEEMLLDADDHLSGEPSAPVLLVEYLDFQCPTCALYHPVVADLETTFDGDLLVVTRHLPLDSIHPNAIEAALASEAAGRQGQFDEMGDLLFDNQSDWSGLADPTATFEGYATQLSLDLTEFRADMADADLAAGISQEFADAIALGATGTPTFFLNNQQISIPAIADFPGVIQDALDAVDDAFTIDRETGEIIVLDASQLTASSTHNLSALVKDLSTSETVDLVINVDDVSAGASSALSIDDAFASEDDWL